MSAGKRDQIEIFFKKKFLSKIDVDLIIWSRTFIISKKNFLSIWSLFPALTPYAQHVSKCIKKEPVESDCESDCESDGESDNISYDKVYKSIN